MSPVRCRSPNYSIKNPIAQNTDIKEKKNELIKNRIEEIRKSWDGKKNKFIDDISISYGKIHRPLGVLKFHKVK